MKLKERLYRLRVSRYQMDQLNLVLLLTFITSLIVGLFWTNNIFKVVIVIILAIFLFRYLSTNYNQRRKENRVFLTTISRIKARFNTLRNNIKYRKTNKYFLCPNCYQQLRVPKNQGTIEISCPKCHNKFSRKS